MISKRHYLLPTPELLSSLEFQLALARRRVARGHNWTKTAYRASQGYTQQFLASHGFLPDEHAGKKALKVAWEELNIKLARAAFNKMA